jgi:hypothetical protein
LTLTRDAVTLTKPGRLSPDRRRSVPSSASATFVYDGDGNRVKATLGGVTTVYVGNYFEWTGSTSTMKKYYYTGGARVAVREGMTLYYILTDHGYPADSGYPQDSLGSTAITVNSDGTEEVGELRTPFPAGKSGLCLRLRRATARAPATPPGPPPRHGALQGKSKMLQLGCTFTTRAITTLFLLSYSLNLNLIERLWKFVKKGCLYSKYYEKFEPFKNAIIDCLAEADGKHKQKLSSLLTLNFQTF